LQKGRGYGRAYGTSYLPCTLPLWRKQKAEPLRTTSGKDVLSAVMSNGQTLR